MKSRPRLFPRHIGALAAIMLISMIAPVSEIITGLIGLAFILMSLWSSVRHNRRISGGKAGN